MKQAWLLSVLGPACLLVACGSSSADSNGGTNKIGVTQWTVSGTLTAPANETATHVKLVVSYDETANSASTYISKPVPLALSGSPPSATFSLAVDATKMGALMRAANATLVVFDDANGDGVNNAGEPTAELSPSDPSCPVWCDGTACDDFWGATFWLLLGGYHGTAPEGPFTISTTGFYYYQGCNDGTCAHLITTANNHMTGVKVDYQDVLVPQ